MTTAVLGTRPAQAMADIRQDRQEVRTTPARPGRAGGTQTARTRQPLRAYEMRKTRAIRPTTALRDPADQTPPSARIARQMILAFRSPARLGRLGEEYTAEILRQRGWTILARNFRTRYGELDIVALTPAGVIAVVEVKTRASLATGLPAQAVTTDKQHHLRLAAQQWLADNPGGGRPLRFDVASLIVRGGRVLLDYREGAF